MKLLSVILTLLCLSLLAACSTKPVLQTVPVYLQPNEALLVKCPPPQLSPSKTNADIIGNSLSRQTAFDICNIYHQCLLEWHAAAAKVAASKGKEVPVPELCGNLIK